MHWLANTFLAWALSLADETAVPGGPAGVAVLGPDPSTGGSIVVGTAFLLDPQEGLLLTATHVLVTAGATSAKKEVKLRFSLPYTRGGVFKYHEFESAAEVIATGSELKTRVSGAESDWAVVQLKSEDTRRMCKGMLKPRIRRDQSQVTLSLEIQRMTSQNAGAFVMGFPAASDWNKYAEVTVQPRPGNRGKLWPIEVKTSNIVGGNSGGPCYWSDNGELWLYGILTEVDLDHPGQCWIIPTHCFIDTLAGSVPRTARVQAVISDTLARGNGISSTESEYLVSQALDEFEALDYWQLKQWLCQQENAPPSAVANLLYDLVSATSDGSAYVGRIAACRPDVRLVIERDIQDIRSSAAKFTGPSQVDSLTGFDINIIKAGSSVASCIASGELVVDRGEWKQTSTFLTDTVTVRGWTFGPSDLNPRNLEVLKTARQFDPTNVDIPSALATGYTGSFLTASDKVMLVSDKVVVDWSEEAAKVRPGLYGRYYSSISGRLNADQSSAEYEIKLDSNPNNMTARKRMELAERLMKAINSADYSTTDLPR